MTLSPPTEWALQLIEVPATSRRPLPVPELEGWPHALPDRFDRIYFGSEFCGHLIPGSVAYARALRLAIGFGVGFTVTTPPVTDKMIDRLVDSISTVMQRPGVELVFNDWGVYHLARERWPQATLRMGRLLLRQVRDPRAGMRDWGRVGLSGMPASWRWTNAGSSRFGALCDRLDIVAAEADFPLHGLDDGALGGGSPRLALHLSYMVCATGRLCAASAAAPKGSDALAPPRTCPGICRDQVSTVLTRWDDQDPAAPPVRLVERGSTQFHAVPPEVVASAARFCETNPVSRIVLSAGVPL